MKNLIYGAIFLLTLTACGNQSSDSAAITNNNSDDLANDTPSQTVTWKLKFPSLWGIAYADDINPEDVTYEQFVDTIFEKLKIDSGFKNAVKGETGNQGVIGPQGVQGISGQDGTDTTLPIWETMYTFGDGNNFFYTCNSNTPCTEDDINLNENSINGNYSLYSYSIEPLSGIDNINSGELITNIRAGQNCEYKAEILTVNSNVEKVLLPSKITGGNVTFNTRGTFTEQIILTIGDASIPLKPRLVITKQLLGPTSTPPITKEQVALEFNSFGTGLVYQLVFKRRCR